MIKSFSKLKKQNKEKFRIPRSAQDIVDVDVIYKDGIFVKGNNYSKVFRFQDINYSIASKDDKMGLFLDYSELLNSFDSSALIKITINNRKIDLTEFKDNVLIKMQNDSLDEYRNEYNEMMYDKIKDTDEIVQEKYITITIYKKNITEARSTFNRYSSELGKYFSKLGTYCQALDTQERLKILHDFYRNGQEENFFCHSNFNQTK